MENLTELSPPLALAFALNVIGYLLKQSPIPNWLIPLILLTLGGAAYPFIAEAGKISYHVNNPMVFNVIIGLCIGGASTGLHQVFRQFMDRKNNGNEPPTNNGTKIA